MGLRGWSMTSPPRERVPPFLLIPHLSGMAKRFRDSILLAMMRGFFDETSDDVSVYLIGGWVADARKWQAFADEWAETLESHPRIEYFRHHESISLMYPKSQFYKWSAKARDEKVLKLTDVIGRHAPDYGMFSVLDLRGFLALIKKPYISRKQMDSMLHGANPHTWCFHDIISAVLQYELMSRTEKQSVEFIFDENSALKKCIREYDDLKSKMPSEVAAIAGTALPADDKKVAALQSADLLAGQLLQLFKGLPTVPLQRLAAYCQILRTDVNPSGWPKAACR